MFFNKKVLNNVHVILNNMILLLQEKGVYLTEMIKKYQFIKVRKWEVLYVQKHYQETYI